MLPVNPGLKFMEHQRKIIQDYFQNYHSLQDQERQEMLELYKQAEEKRKAELERATLNSINAIPEIHD